MKKSFYFQILPLISVVFALFLLSFVSLLFTSCNSQFEQETQEDQEYTLIVNPSFVKTRSAYPEFSSSQLSSLKYIMISSPTTQTEGNYSGGVLSFNFTANLFTKTTFTFYAMDSSNSSYLWVGSSTIDYSLSNIGKTISTSVRFSPYSSSTVKGSVDLKVSSATGTTIDCSVKDSSGEIVQDITCSSYASSQNEYFVKTADAGVSAGEYTLYVFVKNTSDQTLAYYELPIVVWPGITTDRWYLSDGTKNQTYTLGNGNQVNLVAL